nr:hypothetical protein Iba_chr07cCG6920 [Ipomoea batatas]
MSGSDSQNVSGRDYDEGDEVGNDSYSPSMSVSTFNQIDEVENVSTDVAEDERQARTPTSTEEIGSVTRFPRDGDDHGMVQRTDRGADCRKKILRLSHTMTDPLLPGRKLWTISGEKRSSLSRIVGDFFGPSDQGAWEKGACYCRKARPPLAKKSPGGKGTNRMKDVNSLARFICPKTSPLQGLPQSLHPHRASETSWFWTYGQWAFTSG